MSVTLEQIWSATSEQLEQVLKTQGKTLSDNPNLNRAAVAIIHYNSNVLTPADAVWVRFPKFAEIMATASDLKTGLEDVKRGFIFILLLLSEYSYSAVEAASHAAVSVVKSHTDINGCSISGDDVRKAAANAAGVTIRDIARKAVEDIIGSDVSKIITRTVLNLVASTAYNHARDAAEKVAQLPAVTPESIGQATAEAALGAIVKNQTGIQNIVKTLLRKGVDSKDLDHKITFTSWESVGLTLEDFLTEGRDVQGKYQSPTLTERILITTLPFDPQRIILNLLGADLTQIHPRVRRYYLSIISMMIPIYAIEDKETSALLNAIAKKYDCVIG